MASIEWSEVWSDVARRVAEHRRRGRGHLLTEDVLRFETVLALEEHGVTADRLGAEVFAPSLTGGKLDLVVDGVAQTVIELKFPRDSRTGISPDTMTLGELLRDVFRVASVEAEDRWVVQLLNDRLVRYLRDAHRRYAVGWADDAGRQWEVAASSVASLPETARRAMGTIALTGEVSATCVVAERLDAGLVLLAHRVDPLRAVDPSPQTRPSATSPFATPGPTTSPSADPGVGTRDGARHEILAAARAVVARTGRQEFSVVDVMQEMHRRGTGYADNTIRTMMTTHLRADSQGEGIASYTDLVRVDRGVYRLSRASGA